MTPPARTTTAAERLRMRVSVYLRQSSVRNDDDLARLSEDNPGYRFEREADGALAVSPTRTKGGAKSLEAAAQLRDYKKRTGGNAYDSSTGFAIGPGQTIKAPDAAWVSQERIDALSDEEKEGFWPVSPDVAIEVRSHNALVRLGGRQGEVLRRARQPLRRRDRPSDEGSR